MLLLVFENILPPVPKELPNRLPLLYDGFDPNTGFEAITSVLGTSCAACLSVWGWVDGALDLEADLENMLLNSPTPCDCLNMSNCIGFLSS